MKKADVVHNHGVWLAANYYARKAAVKAGKPLVISPRGMLEEWSLGQSKLRKSVVWHLVEDLIWIEQQIDKKEKGMSSRGAVIHKLIDQAKGV